MCTEVTWNGNGCVEKEMWERVRGLLKEERKKQVLSGGDGESKRYL